MLFNMCGFSDRFDREMSEWKIKRGKKEYVWDDKGRGRWELNVIFDFYTTYLGSKSIAELEKMKDMGEEDLTKPILDHLLKEVKEVITDKAFFKSDAFYEHIHFWVFDQNDKIEKKFFDRWSFAYVDWCFGRICHTLKIKEIDKNWEKWKLKELKELKKKDKKEKKKKRGKKRKRGGRKIEEDEELPKKKRRKKK